MKVGCSIIASRAALARLSSWGDFNMRNLIDFVLYLIAAAAALAMGAWVLQLGHAANDGFLYAVCNFAALLLIIVAVWLMMLRIKDLRIAVSYGT